MLRKISARLLAVRTRNREIVRCIHGATLPAPTPPEQLSELVAPFRKETAEEGFVWSSPFGQTVFQNMTVDKYVWKNLAQWHNKIAIVCGVTGRNYTYGKLRDHSAALARRLRNDFKLQPGDTIAISMPNVPEYAVIALGAMEAGLSITLINHSYSAG